MTFVILVFYQQGYRRGLNSGLARKIFFNFFTKQAAFKFESYVDVNWEYLSFYKWVEILDPSVQDF